MFTTAIAAAVSAQPQALDNKIDRLLVDADGLCYFCAGSAETSPSQSLLNVQDKLKAAEAVAGQRATLVATAEGSPKGQRYALATVKPYQGNRGRGPKPKNWAFLRTRMLAGDFGRPLMVEEVAEADDLCASLAGPRTAIHYQDKDFRMMPGWHILWRDYDLVYVPEDCWELQHAGLVYGEKWFWLQMLQGDPADNIPGLPRLFGKLCGPKTAEKYIEGQSRESARTAVMNAYIDHYGSTEKGRDMLLEQARLLWMRKVPGDSWDCVRNGPLRDWHYVA